MFNLLGSPEKARSQTAAALRAEVEFELRAAIEAEVSHHDVIMTSSCVSHT